VKRFRLQNRRTRILSAEEQRRLLDACVRMPKFHALLKLAMITGARIGELLTLRWEDCQDGHLTFWQTKNGKIRRIPITNTIAAVLVSRPRIHPWVFTNAKTEKPYTTIRRVFERALERAKITTGDVTVHTLRQHCSIAHDRARSGRLYGDVDLRPFIDKNVGTLHSPDARTTNRRAGHVRFVHKVSTKVRRRGRTAKRGSRSCLFPEEFWWTAGGSNSRPPRCERGALPTELAAL
jgi:integrase